MSEKQMKKAEIDVGKKYVDKTLLMSIAVLVDDFGFKDDDIAKFAKGFEHVDDFMEKGYLKLRHAAEVVEENTKMRFTIF